MEVSGVQTVQVRMGRSRASVRARAHFRDLDDVRADLDEALGTALKELGLARRPELAVHVGRPPAKKR
jgi:alpha-beta hydrolase superfamily lysophospholipase